MSLLEDLEKLEHSPFNCKLNPKFVESYWCEKCMFVYYIPKFYIDIYCLAYEFKSLKDAHNRIECGEFDNNYGVCAGTATCDEMIIKQIIE